MIDSKLHQFSFERFKEYQNDNDIVTIINSVLQHFDVTAYHHTNRYLDRYLQKGYQKVVMLLIDGMGFYNINRGLDQNDYLRKNMKQHAMTVYPSTTVAATTAITSGRYPIETGWIAWQQYFKEFNKEVVMFLNEGYYDQEAVNQSIENILPFEYVWDLIKQPNMMAESIFPAFKTEGMHSFQDICQRCIEVVNANEKGYLYIYWDKYDDLMHTYGIYDKRCNDYLKMINHQIELLRSRLDSNTLLIVTADHGHINTNDIEIKDYTKLWNCLERNISFETRTPNFFVKAGKEKEFEEEFINNFGDTFILLNKQQVLENKLFGIGKVHPRVLEFLGDYIALAIADIAITGKPSSLIGQHAGFTEEEMLIPLIVLE